MGIREGEEESSYPPKLSLLSLPTKKAEPAGMLTPPLRPPAAVPFVWEEAPGKPRTFDSKGGGQATRHVTRTLELPPRLLSELASPTTVLDGPYVRRSSSCSSFLDRSSHGSGLAAKSRTRERLASFCCKKTLKSSGSYASFNCSSDDGEAVASSPSPASPTSSSARFMGSREREGLCCGENQTKVKITRFRRNGSLSNLSKPSTQFWATIYSSLRHVVPWRVRKLKKDALL